MHIETHAAPEMPEDHQSQTNIQTPHTHRAHHTLMTAGLFLAALLPSKHLWLSAKETPIAPPHSATSMCLTSSQAL